MNITVANIHKNVGKSLITHQLILSYQYRGVEIDPFGTLSRKLPMDVDKIPAGSHTLPNYAFMTIFDFGAFLDKKMEMAAMQSDLILIPFLGEFDSITGTLKTLKFLAELERPFLFVLNRAKEEKAVEKVKPILKKALKSDPEIVSLPDSSLLSDAYAYNYSILEMANTKPAKALHDVAGAFYALHQKMKQFYVAPSTETDGLKLA